MTLWGVDLWGAFLVFARVGAILMLLPAFGENVIPARVRLSFALLLTAVLAPVTAPLLPAEAGDMGGASAALFFELVVGLMLGSIARVLQSALATAGQIAGFETGLAFAQTQDPSINQAGEIIGVFLSLLAVALIFATGLHRTFLEGVAASYQAFPPGRLIPAGDAAEWAVMAAGEAFTIGVRIAAPVMFAGLVFRAALALVQKLAPQIQAFVLSQSLNVVLGLAVLALSISAGALVWIDRMQTFAVELR